MLSAASQRLWIPPSKLDHFPLGDIGWAQEHRRSPRKRKKLKEIAIWTLDAVGLWKIHLCHTSLAHTSEVPWCSSIKMLDEQGSANLCTTQTMMNKNAHWISWIVRFTCWAYNILRKHLGLGLWVLNRKPIHTHPYPHPSMPFHTQHFGHPDPLLASPQRQEFSAWPSPPPPGWRRFCCSAVVLQPAEINGRCGGMDPHTSILAPLAPTSFVSSSRCKLETRSNLAFISSLGHNPGNDCHYHDINAQGST